MIKKRSSPYNPEHVSRKLNISIEEAEKIVEQRKLKTSGSLQSFILRHGEELGRKKYKEFCQKSKHTLNSFIKKYGETEGEEKYSIYLTKKDSRSPNFFQKKYGESWEIEYKEFIDNWKAKLSLNGYIEKYGEELGKEEYRKMCDKKKHNIDSFRLRYGEELAEEKYYEYRKSKDKWSLDFYLEKYGVSKGRMLYDERCRNASSVFRKLCEMYEYEEACKKYEQFKKNEIESPIQNEKISKYVRLNSGPISKSANKFFDKLETALDRNLQYGSKKGELKLFDPINSRMYFCDCYDPKTNTVIEYNGSAFHYHEKFGEDWTSPFGETKETSIVKDNKKNDFIRSMGYNVILIWDFETSGIRKTEKTIEKIQEQLNEFEKLTRKDLDTNCADHS